MKEHNVNELNFLLENLNKLLMDDGIETTDDKLIVAINVYDKIYLFLKEIGLIYQKDAKERYNFVYNKKNNTSEEDNYGLFKSVLELTELRGLYLLNYPMMLSKMNESFFNRHASTPIVRIDLLLTLYLTFFDEENDLEDKYIFNHVKSLEDIINNYYRDVIDSDYVSDNEKRVIIKYNDLFKQDELFIKYQDGFHEQFVSFANISWAYFVINNKIIYEYGKVINFLETVSSHYGEIVFKLATAGIENDQDMLKFIKQLYEDNKILNLKQIR